MTESFCKSVPAPAKGSQEHPDTGPGAQRGLLLTVTSSGVRTFSCRYRLRGERRRIPLGRVGEVPLKLARTKAAEILASVGAGVSPHRVETATLAAQFDAFMAERELTVRRPDIDRALWTNHCAGPLRATVWQPQDVEPADVDRLLAGLVAKGLGPNSRRSVHRILGVFFGWAVRRGVIPSSPVPTAAPAPRVQREGVPTLAEMQAIWTWACSPASGAAGPPLALICLTGLRQREATGLMWSEVHDLDETDARLVIDAARMKGKRAHVVPLSPQAVAIIREQERVRNWSSYVFPRRRVEGRPFDDGPTGTNIPETLRASKVAPGVVVHDLRKGAAGGLASLGVPPHVIGLTLAHAPGRVFGPTSSIYLKADYLAERRDAICRWADLLCG